MKTSKRVLDILLSVLALLILGPLILIVVIIQSIETRGIGIFCQERVGKNGRLFKIYKIRTMRKNTSISTSVTTSNDSRITKFGSILRKYKIDEIPQFLNVLIGDMSIVGPRPDVSELTDNLSSKDRIILSVKPGITGPSSLIMINEEELLSRQENPEDYNLNILLPKKIAINKEYIKNWSIYKDIKIIIKTILVIINRLLTH